MEPPVRVLVTGAAGQVGREVVLHCERRGDHVLAADHASLDCADRDAVLSCVGAFRPDAVINCAAWTAVDACESDPLKAMRDNGFAVRLIAEACSRFGAHLVHLSTDYVFSGDLDRPYHEWDEPDPKCVYGTSKLAGEREIMAVAPGSTIVRTAWVCGEHGPNIVKTVLRLASERDELAFVDDQVGNPTFTVDLAPVVRRLAVDRRPGLHHVTNSGSVSWCGFAREIFTAAGLDPGRVRPITTAELDPPRPARRPPNSRLDNMVLRWSGLAVPGDFREPLARLVSILRN
jgi:dTDP-4-dehydrorhamnose reductase